MHSDVRRRRTKARPGLPNHVSWLDATTLFATMDSPPLFAIDAQVARRWWVRPLLRLVPTLPVEAGIAYAVRTMVQAVRDGKRLVLFPEGRITITGSLMEVQHGAASIADKAGIPVVPVRLEGLERTFLSRLSAQQTRRALFPTSPSPSCPRGACRRRRTASVRPAARR